MYERRVGYVGSYSITLTHSPMHALDMLLGDIGRRVKAADQYAIDRQTEREREKYEEMQRMLGYVDNKVSRQWSLDLPKIGSKSYRSRQSRSGGSSQTGPGQFQSQLSPQLSPTGGITLSFPGPHQESHGHGSGHGSGSYHGGSSFGSHSKSAR